MSGRERSRREFLLNSLSGIGAAWAVANYAGIEEAHAFVQQAAQYRSAVTFAFFTAAQAAEVEAMAAQIIPTDSHARRARSARHQVHRPRPDHVREGRAGRPTRRACRISPRRRRQLFPQATTFSALTSDQQIKVLTAMEKTPFFNLVRTHTITGFFASPVHGGNDNKVGLEAGQLRRLAEPQAAIRLLRRASRLHQPLNALEIRHGTIHTSH